MEKYTVGIAEAKRALSEIVNRVLYRRERIILQSRGRSKAALISIEDLRKLERLEQRETQGITQQLAVLSRARTLRETMPVEAVGTAAAELGRLREERVDGLSGLY